jgi:Holliday junction DNA helicase RuvA
MIAYLTGKIQFKRGNFLVVLVNGIGYKVSVPQEIFSRVKDGEEITLYTYHHVREDSQQLFGFESFDGLTLFELLISVSGVGPKTALNVFSIADIADVKAAIMNGDAAILKKVSGIGGKTAERIVLELRNKVDEISDLKLLKSKEDLDSDADAVEALNSLGYSRQQVKDALKSVDPSVKDVSLRVKAALRFLK